jgi:hypothetical protein
MAACIWRSRAVSKGARLRRERGGWPEELILVLDEGTTSTRAMLFAADGRCAAWRSAS